MDNCIISAGDYTEQPKNIGIVTGGYKAMNVVDKLIERTIDTKNPTVISLDSDVVKILACYKRNCNDSNPLSAIANVIYAFNCDIIDIVSELVPAVKPQMAFYKKYGSYGVAAFEKLLPMPNQKVLL